MELGLGRPEISVPRRMTRPKWFLPPLAPMIWFVSTSVSFHSFRLVSRKAGFFSFLFSSWNG